MKMLAIVLLTACNQESGSGHFWRMTTLLDLLHQAKHHVLLLSDFIPANFPDHLRPYTINELPNQCVLIIRDLRDSTPSISNYLLTKCNKVITIDDAGDCSLYHKSIKLLPTAGEELFLKSDSSFPFLYGYHFYETISSLTTSPKKDIDLLVYTGFKQDEYPLALNRLAKKFRIAIFNGSQTSIVNEKNQKLSYHDIILRSKTLVSHFGLSLYEAALCGVQAISLNPGSYHSQLAVSEKRIVITNLGTFDQLSEARYLQLENLVIKSNQHQPPCQATLIKKRMNQQHQLFLNELAL